MANTEKIVAVHTLGSTSPEKYEAVLDHGHFISDLAERDRQMIITNRNSFDTGEILKPSVGSDGLISFNSETLSLGALRTIGAMHNRVLSNLTAPEAILIPKLNDNRLKKYARSKHRLFQEVLHDYQVPTELATMGEDGFTDVAAALEKIEAQTVIVKSDSGTGGASMQRLERTEVVQWAASVVDQGKESRFILQPDIQFGKLPAGIKGVGESEEALIKRARREDLLTELRMLTVKNGEAYQFVPVMRVVTEKGARMGSESDVYVDVELPDELEGQLHIISQSVVEAAAGKAGGISQALAAADYYFTPEGGVQIMELNLRSPQIPRTRTNPLAGRRIHQAVADSLATMSSKESV